MSFKNPRANQAKKVIETLPARKNPQKRTTFYVPAPLLKELKNEAFDKQTNTSAMLSSILQERYGINEAGDPIR
ncbi:hypothetical protein GP475_06845 [Corynebacterium poyangense]|uniref:Uncharacterized protein n=1 Tax=Corynebacterium poyangense TaxID=2684405 RepID=A0A7H0SPA9_9CORY|nr:hypothetical protein [Corynebacterium poyangense]MBZ8177959.1 hypothetical protein [Corynebacterium poyangense]QNQ90384.1 hypothetical protein GP475_06845 [Corynebacterium poyangense]